MIFIRKAIGVTLLAACASLILALIIVNPQATIPMFCKVWAASFFFIEAVVLGGYLLIKEEGL